VITAPEFVNTQVDTDADVGVDEVPLCDPAAGREVVSCSGARVGVDSGSEDEGEEASPGGDGSRAPARASGAPRHAPGTWKIAEYLWFYVTRTPSFTDIKCHMKSGLRNVTTGMGIYNMSKTLTPWHYADDWSRPWRTLLLLRAWSIWRAKLHGWANAKPCRQREVARQEQCLEADVRSSHVGEPTEPLLGNSQAHILFVKWAPSIARSVLGHSSSARALSIID